MGPRHLLGLNDSEKYTEQNYADALVEIPDADLRSKKELIYHKIFLSQFGDDLLLDILGRTRSLTKFELN